MSNIYFANNSAFTPSTQQNWVLDAGTTIVGNYARVLEVSWGGELTTTTAMRTAIAKGTVGFIVLFGIAGLGTFFYGLENTTRAFKIAAGKDGVSMESSAAPEAAQAVATAAQDEADAIKENG